MPELPDVDIYIEAVAARTIGQKLVAARLGSPFLVRSVEPPLSACVNQSVVSVERIGKRIVLGFSDELFIVIHLMIAGRLHWTDQPAKLPGKRGLLALDFEHGSLSLTEAGSKRRASLHVVRGRTALVEFNRGGREVDRLTLAEFKTALTAENHTLKRSLTDPRIFSGIGNSYSDEILHRARLSPIALSQKLDDADIARLFTATNQILREWTDRLRTEAAGKFPEKVTAFRPEMAVHGRYRLPCPVCGSPVQRIVYASNETNYCATCQTGGDVLADRALSRLLRGDWPRSLEEQDELRRR